MIKKIWNKIICKLAAKQIDEAYDEGYRACHEMCEEEDFDEYYWNGYQKAYDEFANSCAVDWIKYYNYIYDYELNDIAKEMFFFTKDENGTLMDREGKPVAFDERGNVLNAEE